MKRYLTLVLTLLTIAACASEIQSLPGVMERLEQEGQPYFQELVSSGQYEVFLDAIESGSGEHIAGAAVLANWTDASTAVSLKYALSRAIISNPDAVMKLIPGSFAVGEVCTVPYIEEPIEVELRHVRESLVALNASAEPSQAHAQCMDAYQVLESNISSTVVD